ncbi:hypothetical protein E6H31_02120 [Candidatus Bathyarchaeota archaeon]|nr:MAG: hypothetical protein E6H31_02120 [Candidatus Bathyarchaeota archaeon]
MKESITAVCISGKEEAWSVPEIPFYCHTAGFKESPHYPPVMTRERVQYLSTRRNEANRRALELNPNTEHFLSIDSYYLNQTTEIRKLVKEYGYYDADCVLGATNWFLDHSKLPSKMRFWDTWATPEMRKKSYNYQPRNEGIPEGWERVRGCGGFTLYPRWLWEKRGYGIPEPFPKAGNEVNYLCNYPWIPTYVTFNVKAHRETPEELLNRSFARRLRTTIGLRSRLWHRRSEPRRLESR